MFQEVMRAAVALVLLFFILGLGISFIVQNPRGYLRWCGTQVRDLFTYVFRRNWRITFSFFFGMYVMWAITEGPLA